MQLPVAHEHHPMASAQDPRCVRAGPPSAVTSSSGPRGARFVLVVTAQPGYGYRQALLVASLRGTIKELVGGIERVEAAPTGWCRANGQLAFDAYLRDPGVGPRHAMGLLVFTLTGDQISAISSSAGVQWRGGQLHRDAEPAGGAGGEGEGPLVCLGDALDDCQAEADTCVAGAHAFGAALKRLDQRRNYLWTELFAAVLDSEHHGFGVDSGRDPHGALFRQIMDDRVVHEVRSQLPQERPGAGGGGSGAGGLDDEPTLFCEGEE